MSEVAIGPASLLEEAPVVVEVEGARHVLSVRDGEPMLFSAVCPHQGGRVRVADEETLLCPNHRWQFDARTGEHVSGDGPGLTEARVAQRDGTLFAVLE